MLSRVNTPWLNPILSTPGVKSVMVWMLVFDKWSSKRKWSLSHPPVRTSSPAPPSSVSACATPMR